MRPGDWKLHPDLQLRLTAAHPSEVQRAVQLVMNMQGDNLVNVALGARAAPNQPPVGGVIAAIEAAVASGIIFVLTNEDPRYAARRAIQVVEGADATQVLDAARQASAAAERLRKEDPRR